MIWKILTRSLVAFVLIIALFRLGDTWMRRGTALPKLPDPNGYDRLLVLSRQVTAPRGDLADLSAAAILALGNTNRETLGKVREVLKSETAVSLGADRGWVEKHAEDLKSLKKLSVVLAIQSRAAELEKNTNVALGYFLDVVRLGHAMARGGLLTDAVSGLTAETIGVASVRSLIPALGADAAAEAARELEHLDTSRELPEQILARERQWARASFGLYGWVGDTLLQKSGGKRGIEFFSRHQDIVHRTRRVMLSLAARSIEARTGKRVTDPAQLVPSVLKAVPLEPGKSTPMTEIPSYL